MTTDVALAKLATIERCLERIRAVTAGNADAVDNLDTEELVVLNLQRAVQAAIDLAAHTISGRNWGLPETLKAHFGILADQRAITPELSKRLQAMVGFRNIAVHDYQRIDREILKSILKNHLDDLREFAAAVKALVAW